MAVGSDDVRSGARQLAGALLRDVDAITERSTARMHELLPSYARVPRDELEPIVSGNARRVLELIHDPATDRGRIDADFRLTGDTRARQGISSDEMLRGWRIILEVTREQAHVVAAELGLGKDTLLEFIEATLLWGDVGMRETAAAHHEAEIRELARLASEQAALRRVATLVAGGETDALFAVVAEQIAGLLEVPYVSIVRYEGDGTATERAGRSAPPAERTVTVPIVAAGDLWGAIVVAAPADAASRLASFADLVGMAMANSAARAQVERLADEQAALRRVATMVARESPAEEVFNAVAEEVGRLLGVETVSIWRFEPDRETTVVAAWGEVANVFAAGSRWELDEDSIVAEVHRTGRSHRIDGLQCATGSLANRALQLGSHSGVAGPIVVNGRLWGAIVAGTLRDEPLHPASEARIAQFTELAATAIANVQAREDLAASRARLAATADEERRRLVRDLHDGAQQRLVHTIITLKRARRALAGDGDGVPALVEEALEQAKSATGELRALAHGILPAVLTSGGLRAAVRALASSMSIPVDAEVCVGRLAPAVEATAYFVVSEALTNVAKHARARHAIVGARLEDGALQVVVSDDGIGGARPDGSGLVGLADRLAAHDGKLRVESPAGGGTRIAATIPV